MRTRQLPALVLVISALAACSSPSDAPAPGDDTASAPTAASLLTELGAESVYLMAGDDVLRAGLARLDAASTEAAAYVLKPEPALISNVSGNGNGVVLGAAGRADQNTVSSDVVYTLQGSRLRTESAPRDGLLGPAIGSQGQLAAVNANGGLSIRWPGESDWTRDPRLRRHALTTLAWTHSGDLVTTVGRGTGRLVVLGRNGNQRSAGPAFCAVVVLTSPNGRAVATVTGVRQPASAPGACSRGHVVDLRAGKTTARVPIGWRPLGWSRDSTSLLVSRGDELAVWALDGRFLARMNAGVETWMAALTYAK